MTRVRLPLLLLVVLVLAGCGGGDDGQVLRGETEPTPIPRAADLSLSFHPVLGAGDAAALTPEDAIDPSQEMTLLDDAGEPIRLGPAALTREHIEGAAVEEPEFGPVVMVDFNAEGARRWTDLTGRAACNPPLDPTRRVAIVLDGEVLSSPQLDSSVRCNEGIEGGSTQITGDFTPEQAEELAALIGS